MMNKKTRAMIDASVISARLPLQARAERIRTFSVNYLMGRSNIGILRRLVKKYGTDITFDRDLVVYNGGKVCVSGVGYDGHDLVAVVCRLDGSGKEDVNLLRLLQVNGVYEGVFNVEYGVMGKHRDEPFYLTRYDIAEVVRAMLIQCARNAEK